ncbi:DUF4350 domain-containing protein [Gilvimarinus sp. F26214L]|uniref:DUF4350 domain-containing protein n=1 Tax=Gilvimarinus sp. DZF01 TaxID=3461371 RepID=UPI00404545BC
MKHRSLQNAAAMSGRVQVWHIALVLLTCALIYLLVSQLERYEEVVNQGWSLEALRNPFLAAEQYLAAMGRGSESSDRLDALDELTVGSTLLIRNANHVLNEQRANDLLAWLEQGGHVIVGAQLHDEDRPDVLLSRFQVSKHPLDEFESEDEEEAGGIIGEIMDEVDDTTEADASPVEPSGAENQTSTPLQSDIPARVRAREARAEQDEVVQMKFEAVDHSPRVHFGSDASLSHPVLYLDEEEIYSGPQPFYWTGNEYAVEFMQFDVGDGLLTVMTDIDIWTSDRISLFDHAYLLDLLTAGSDKVIFLYGALVPNLVEIVWRHFREFVVIIALLCAAWMMHRLRRFGPLVASEDSSRRSFQEHVQATGSFLWRQGEGELLLEPLREQIWAALQRHLPGAGPGDHGRLQKLASLTGMEPATIRQLMQAPAPADEIQFIETVKRLQRIRKAL